MSGILWAIVVLLVIFWLVGAVLNLFGGIIHFALILAAVLFVVNMFLGGRTRV